MSRSCAQCGRILPQTSYSANQWSKGQGGSRCVSCVHGHYLDNPAARPPDSGRYSLIPDNTPYAGLFSQWDLANPFAEGAFRFVAKGVYTFGERQGQANVAKWFKSGAVFSQDYFTLDIKAVDKALEIVNRFNQLDIVDKQVRVNIPQVCVCMLGPWAGQLLLVEPFIQNYQKFNSNTGWCDDHAAWSQVMQALSHFSYHVTGGNYVLCDLQGGVYQQEIVLSDPVILSRNREYGVTDLGPDGISTFFYEHYCNDYCRPTWTSPANSQPYYKPVPGTTMVRRTVPTVRGAPANTQFYS